VVEDLGEAFVVTGALIVFTGSSDEEAVERLAEQEISEEAVSSVGDILNVVSLFQMYIFISFFFFALILCSYTHTNSNIGSSHTHIPLDTPIIFHIPTVYLPI